MPLVWPVRICLQHDPPEFSLCFYLLGRRASTATSSATSVNFPSGDNSRKAAVRRAANSSRAAPSCCGAQTRHGKGAAHDVVHRQGLADGDRQAVDLGEGRGEQKRLIAAMAAVAARRAFAADICPARRTAS